MGNLVLMAEMAHAGGEHGNAGCIGGGDRFGIPDGAAGVDDGRDAGPGSDFDRIGEGEERIGGHDCALRFFLCSISRDPHAIYPIRLSTADPDCCFALGKNDCV